MSRHVTYRGTTIDMDSFRRENEKVSAIGNMAVNAKGDQISRNTVTKTSEQIARENHRVQTAIVSTSLKGKHPTSPETTIEVPATKPKKTAAVDKKSKEVELPSGDIIIQEDSNEN